MEKIINQLPFIESIYQEKVEIDQSFENIASKFAKDYGTVVLLSGTDLSFSRYHILAALPWLFLTSKQEKLELKYLNHKFIISSDPIEFIDKLIHHFSINKHNHKDLDPVSAGLFGYFAYDLKDRFENFPRTCVDSGLPDICLFFPSAIFIFDKKTNQSTLSIPVISLEQESGLTRVENIRKLFFNRISLQESQKKDFTINLSNQEFYGFKSNFSKSSYIKSLEKIIEYIKVGDVYQVNLSQRFEAGFTGNPYSLFIKLFKKNPAPFFAYINAKDHFIVSTSPERFIKRCGNKIETRPIKGTIPRGTNKKEDKEFAEKLMQSKKDDAELSMIVDLMRNDFGRVAKSGTVFVNPRKHKMLEPYDNVFHLVSVVEAELEKNKTFKDIIRATFPGGSITGCPKIRAIEIIDELESHKRHVYTGSIGYLSFHNTIDLSIAIRTAIIADKKINFSVGGGIVYDSDPEKEYEETMHKGKTLMEILLSKSKKQKTKKAWINGKIINENQANVSAISPAFQYGAGLFETIRLEKGIPIRLKEHLNRLNTGFKKLFNNKPPDITWEHVIAKLVLENNLSKKTGLSKIICAKNIQKNSYYIACFAKSYIHRLNTIGKKGISLITYPYPRQTPIADFKTLNYFYYYLASLYAKKNNGDEALILNPDMTVSETNTCNIMAVKSKEIIIPESKHVLDGVTLNAALKVLSKSGYKIIKKKIDLKTFFSFGYVILTNALMGAVPVISLDKNKLKFSNKICDLINSFLITP
ncbi:MAG: aminodeoxychorismate synthase, component I [Desulfobacteraceae bacterium 4572_130]|nr:MAG: aminodeoxychorismate synthase, component I [Desulfobacteraceae bacterium 4572_130]